jgi:hypothetical protein
MLELLCRNRVEDYQRWWGVFESHASAHREAGLELADLWRDLEDPNNVFFLFRVGSLEKTRAFIRDPSAADAGAAEGVLDGEYYFLERGELRGDSQG